MALKPNATETQKPAGKKASAAKAAPAPAPAPAPAEEKKPAGTAVAKAEPAKGGALVTAEDAALFLEDAQRGKNFSKDDLAMPFLRVLQKGSPQVNTRDDKAVEGAQIGMFLNTVTNELWDGEEGLIIVPVSYTPSYIEWKPRKAGGGLVRDYGADASIMRQTTVQEDDQGKKRNVLSNGNEVVYNMMYYVLIVDADNGDFQQVAFPLGGMQLKKARKWNTYLAQLRAPRPDGHGSFNPALFYSAFQLTSVYETKDSFDWMGVNIVPFKFTKDLPNGLNIYRAARDFAQLIESGAVKAQPIPDAEVVEAEEEAVPSVTGQAASAASGDEEF